MTSPRTAPRATGDPTPKGPPLAGRTFTLSAKVAAIPIGASPAGSTFTPDRQKRAVSQGRPAVGGAHFPASIRAAMLIDESAPGTNLPQAITISTSTYETPAEPTSTGATVRTRTHPAVAPVESLCGGRR